MNIQHGQDLGATDRSCPCERLDSVAQTRGKLREKGGKHVESSFSVSRTVTLWFKSNELCSQLKNMFKKKALRRDEMIIVCFFSAKQLLKL